MGASGKGVEREQPSRCQTLSRAVSGGETGTCLPDGQSNTASCHAAPSSRATSGQGARPGRPQRTQRRTSNDAPPAGRTPNPWRMTRAAMIQASVAILSAVHGG